MNASINRLMASETVKLATAAAIGVGLSLLLPDFSIAWRMKMIDFTVAELTETEKAELGGCDMYYTKVSPADLDLNNHVNNAKFVKDLNFTRRRFFVRYGIQRILREQGKSMVVQAQTIRYRKELKRGDRYSIKTEIIACSDRESSFYVQSKFLNHLEFVLAIHHCKYRIVAAAKGSTKGKGSLPTGILKEVGLGDTPSADVHGNVPFIDAWNDANAVSSNELNPKTRGSGSSHESRKRSASNKEESMRLNSKLFGSPQRESWSTEKDASPRELQS